MHAHGIEVLDRADDDAVVRLVAHHLHFVFFPAQQRFLDQQFVGGGCFQSALADGFEFFGVVGDAAACSAQRETGTDDGREANVLLHVPGLSHAVRHTASGRTQADARHGILEFLAIFRLINGLGRGANQFHFVLVQHAVAPQIQRAVQRSLTAHGGQNGVGALFGDDFFHRLPGNRLDVGHVGRGGIGHDRRRIAVDQDDAEAFLAQRLAGLHTRIVKLAGLADDNGAGTDDQNALNVLTFGHGSGRVIK